MLKRINAALLLAIILINAYVLYMPVRPALTYWLQQRFTNRAQELTTVVETSPNSNALGAGNRMVIPSMLLNEEIHEGKTIAAAEKGVWHRPQSSTPDKGGNTVLVGHRFTYKTPKGVFYHLDLMKAGDHFAVFWNGQKYLYKVAEIKTVASTAGEVEAPTDTDQLTLYTCTPLWSAKERLVIVAKPIGGSDE
jgi:sortase A